MIQHDSNEPLVLQNFNAAVLDDGSVLHSAVLETAAGSRPLWFRFEEAAKSMADVPPAPEAFILALLRPVMLVGCDLYIDGTVDAEFLYKLNQDVVPLLCSHSPELKAVRIYSKANCGQERRNTEPASAKPRLLGMSCGLDSLTAYLENQEATTPSSLKVDGLLFCDIGAFGGQEEKFQYDLGHVKGFAKDNGLPLYLVRSNIDQFYREIFELSMSLRNVAAAWALHGICHSVMYASSYSYKSFLGAAATEKNASILEPVLFPLLSIEDFAVVSHGFIHIRSAKFALLLNYPNYIKYLNVCTRSPAAKQGFINCGHCRKCSTILFMAESVGRIGEFSSTFNMPKFLAKRRSLLFRMVYMSYRCDPSFSSINALEYYRENGGRIPLIIWVFALAAAGMSHMAHLLKHRKG